MDNQLEIITWKEFAHGIAPLWSSDDPDTTPIWNNPYGIVQYPQEKWHTDIIYFPAQYWVNNDVVGYISVYNLSDYHIRSRGIYIKPEYRGQGFGHCMQRAAWDLFPKSFYRAFIWSRENNVERFCEHSNMKVVPGAERVWSEFSQLYMTMLYHDRGPLTKNAEANQTFLASARRRFSLGGSNNLGVDWTPKEWYNYFEEHQGNYVDLDLDLDFKETRWQEKDQDLDL